MEGNHIDDDDESDDDEDDFDKGPSGFKILKLMGAVLCLGTQDMRSNIPQPM